MSKKRFRQVAGGSWKKDDGPHYLNPPDVCDICGKPIDDEFVDGQTNAGPWANMCMICYPIHGRGLGIGLGQHYVAEETD